ncbi:hypothetical protein, partial [Parvimonas sp. D9]|uniref:hypothetical protein n=1 Tax=Parvimonas sp. D9 TaxID=3110689 RepID=UPI002B47E787
AGLKLMTTALAERGINADEHMRAIAQMNATIDTLGLALDGDPRRVTDSGVLQVAAGYINPKAGQATELETFPLCVLNRRPAGRPGSLARLRVPVRA